MAKETGNEALISSDCNFSHIQAHHCKSENGAE